jgi:acyl-CoA thioesterase-2
MAESEQLVDLVHLLDLEETAEDRFAGRQPKSARIRVFGGQVAGQALVAAGRTVDADRPVHSLHAYFLRAGDPKVPIEYAVERLRDGRSFSARRVVAWQHGEAIFSLAASFQLPADGVEHQVAMPAELPPPEALPTLAERLEPYRDRIDEWWTRPRAIDLRHVGEPPYLVNSGIQGEPRQMLWMRADGQLPDDPLLHVCVVAYASDMTLLDSVLLAHGVTWDSGRVKAASLDHAMWFHRPVRADEWLLYVQESPTAGGARGFSRAQIFARDGRLVVSVAQEGMVRLVDWGERRRNL